MRIKKFFIVFVLTFCMGFSGLIFFGCDAILHLHDWGNWKITTAPTCTEVGEETRHCAGNEEHIAKRFVDALGHDLILLQLDYEGSVPNWSCKRYGCNYTEKATDEYGGIISSPYGIGLNGVSIKTQQECYAENVATITVTWKNNADITLSYGDSYHIEKKINGEWYKIFADKEVCFNTGGYLMYSDTPAWEARHAYHISNYTDRLAIGDYRIATYFSASDKTYSVYADFKVVSSISFEMPSGRINFIKSNLFTMITSKDELNSVALDYDADYYNDDFFAENALIALLFTTPNLGNVMQDMQIQKHGDKLTVLTDFHDGMMTAIGHYGTVMEISKTDIEGVTSIERKNECNCPPYLVTMIFITLTPQATVLAYNANKTYTPVDFPEYNFASIENLFIMKPNGPDFKRIMFAYLAEPVHPNDETLLKAIELINQRPDVDHAG